MIRAKSWLVALAALWAPLAAAFPFELAYDGRLTRDDGSPVDGQVSLRVKFYKGATGDQDAGVGVPDFAGVVLKQGVFHLSIVLPPADFHAVFGGGEPVWIEVLDLTAGRTYPKQRFSTVPYALHVPVDGTTIGYNASGELTSLGAAGVASVTGAAPVTVTGAPSAPVVGMTQATTTSAGYLTAADWTTFNGKQAALGFTPVNKAGDAMGGALDMGAHALTNLAAPAAAADAATKAYADGYLGGFALDQSTKNDQYVVKWDTTAGKFVLGADQLGAAGGGIQTINGLNPSAQTLAVGAAGTAPAWSSATSTHTLNIPMASTAGVTAGLLSKTDYDAFTAKQPAITPSSTITTGTLNLGANAHAIGLKAPAALGGDPVFTLPGADGTNGQVLQTDGAGNLTWVAQPTVATLATATTASAGTMSGADKTSLDGLVASALVDGDFGVNGLMRRTAAGTYDTVTDGSTNWTTGYNERRQWDGSGTNLVAATGRASLGLGGLATLSAVGSSEVTDDTIVDADINASAAIAQSKISGLTTALAAKGDVFNGGQAGALTLGTTNATSLTLKTNNTAAMTIASGGNVMMGTTTPQSTLTVHGGANPAGVFIAGQGDGAQYSNLLLSNGATGTSERTWFWSHRQDVANNMALFYYDGSTYSAPLNVTATGNVGIGTTSPAAPLHVKGNVIFDYAPSGSDAWLFFRDNAGTGNKAAMAANNVDNYLYLFSRGAGLRVNNAANSATVAQISDTGDVTATGTISAANVGATPFTSVQTAARPSIGAGWSYASQYLQVTVPAGATRRYRVSMRILINSNTAGQIIVALQTSPSTSGTGVLFSPHAYAPAGVWVTVNAETLVTLGAGTTTYYLWVYCPGTCSVANANTDVPLYTDITAYPY